MPRFTVSTTIKFTVDLVDLNVPEIRDWCRDAEIELVDQRAVQYDGTSLSLDLLLNIPFEEGNLVELLDHLRSIGAAEITHATIK